MGAASTDRLIAKRRTVKIKVKRLRHPSRNCAYLGNTGYAGGTNDQPVAVVRGLEIRDGTWKRPRAPWYRRLVRWLMWWRR